jgi:hypothetical protein
MRSSPSSAVRSRAVVCSARLACFRWTRAWWPGCCPWPACGLALPRVKIRRSIRGENGDRKQARRHGAGGVGRRVFRRSDRGQTPNPVRRVPHRYCAAVGPAAELMATVRATAQDRSDSARLSGGDWAGSSRSRRSSRSLSWILIFAAHPLKWSCMPPPLALSINDCW